MPPITPATRRIPFGWRGWDRALLVTSGLTVLALLYLYDPETNAGFLPCPFRWLTGLLCPGCGAQRAIHDLLHGRVAEAFGHNPALVVSLPLLGMQWAIPKVLRSQWQPEWDNRIVYTWLVLLVGWGVFRNVWEAPHLH